MDLFEKVVLILAVCSGTSLIIGTPLLLMILAEWLYDRRQ